MFWGRWLALAVLWAGPALGQSNPGFVQGAVLCANSGCSTTPPINPLGLNQAFMLKQDVGGGSFAAPITFTDAGQTILDYSLSFGSANQTWALQRRFWYFTPGKLAAANAALTPYDPAIAAYFDYSNPLASIQGGLLGYLVNNSPSIGILPFAAGGIGILQSAGSQVTGIFGGAHAQVNGVAYNNTAVWNDTANAPPTSLPPDTRFQPPASPQTVTIAHLFSCGGHMGQMCSMAMGVVQDGIDPQPFQDGLYFWANSVTRNAIYVDSTPTVGPAQSMVLKNTGQGTNVAQTIYTVGTLQPHSTFFQHVDTMGNPTVRMWQNGSVHSILSPLDATTDPIEHQLCYPPSGMVDCTSGGTTVALGLNANITTGYVRTNGALLVDATNGVRFRTGAGLADGIDINSSQGVTMAGLPTTGTGAYVCIDSTDFHLYRKASCP